MAYKFKTLSPLKKSVAAAALALQSILPVAQSTSPHSGIAAAESTVHGNDAIISLKRGVPAIDPLVTNPGSASVNVDEQIGMTFGDPSYTSLSVDVNAVAQTDPATGEGPAYLLNGLTNNGWWYQIGVDYNWPGGPAGFNLIFMQWAPGKVPGPVEFLLPTNNRISAGDNINLSMSAQNGTVTVSATDLTSNTALVSDPFQVNGTTNFAGGIMQNGYFTGVMSEEWHANDSFVSQSPVTYTLVTQPTTTSLFYGYGSTTSAEIETYAGNKFTTGSSGAIQLAQLNVYSAAGSSSTQQLQNGGTMPLGTGTLSLNTLLGQADFTRLTFTSASGVESEFTVQGNGDSAVLNNSLLGIPTPGATVVQVSTDYATGQASLTLYNYTDRISSKLLSSSSANSSTNLGLGIEIRPFLFSNDPAYGSMMSVTYSQDGDYVPLSIYQGQNLVKLPSGQNIVIDADISPPVYGSVTLRHW